MTRQSRVETREYRTRKNTWGFMTYSMVFVSLMLIVSGMLAKGAAPADLTVIPEAAPKPTPVTQTFDETPDERRLSLPSNQWFALQLGVYESKESAEVTAASYRQRGAAGYVWQEGDRNRILAAVYSEEDDAQRVREKLRTQQNIDTYVYEIAAEDVTIEFKGMKGQLDAIEACFDKLRQTPMNLLKLSRSLDAQETDTAEAKRQLKNEANDLKQLTQLISQRFIKPYHPLVEGMETLLNSWSSCLEQLSLSEENEAAFGGRVKYETLALIQSAKVYYKTLTQ